MSSVPSASSDSSMARYYESKLKEKTDETELQTKKTNEDHDQEISRLRELQKAALLKKETEADETIQNIRSKSAESSAIERERYQNALKDLKHENYNHRGISSMNDKSSDAGLIHYYQSKLKEQNDANDSQAEQIRKAHDKEMERIAQQHRSSLLKKEAEANTTVRNMRNETSEAISNERNKYQAVLDKMKDEDSSRRGLSSKESLNTARNAYADYQRKIDEVKNEAEKTQKRTELRADDDQKNLEHHYKEVLNKKDKEFKESIKDLKLNANTVGERSTQRHNAEVEELQNDLRKAKQDPVPGGVPLSTYKYKINGMLEAEKERAENNKANLEAQSEQQTHKMKDLELRTSNKIKRINEDHVKNVKDLREQVDDLSGHSTTSTKDKAQTSGDLVKENDRIMRSETNRMNETFDHAVGKLEENIRDQESYYQDLNRKTVKEKEEHYAKTIAKINNENHSNMKNLEKSFTQQFAELEKARNIEQKKASEALENAIVNSTERNELALNKQATNYQDLVRKTYQNQESQIKTLQRALKDQQTSSNTALISPAAESSVRNSVIQQYEKVLNTEQENRKQETDHIQQKYKDLVSEIQMKNEDKETKIRQENEYQRSMDRSVFFDTMQETEEKSKLALRSEEHEREQEKEKIYKQFSNVFEKQRRSYENLLDTTKYNSQERLAEERLAAASLLKSTQRSATTRQSELVREYEKKLSEQKVDYDFQISELKSRARTDLREQENKTKREMEKTAAEYELKLAQLKEQAQERERYVAQGYQDELDKTRRAYELLSKKKS